MEDSRGLPLRAAVGASSDRLQWKAWQRLRWISSYHSNKHHVQKELGQPAAGLAKTVPLEDG